MKTKEKTVKIIDSKKAVAKAVVQAAKNKKAVNNAIKGGKAHELKEKGYQFLALDV
jgi:hypothetical protein